MESTTTNTERDEVLEHYRDVPEEIRGLIDNKVAAATVNEASVLFGLDAKQQSLLENEVLLVLLLLLPRDGLANRVQESLEIEEKQARELTDYLENNLFDLVDDILELAAGELFGPSKVAAMELDSKDTVPPIRTFESDMRGVHGYGAFAGNINENAEENVYRSAQDSVLAKKENDKGIPLSSTNYSQYSVPTTKKKGDIENPSTEPPQPL